MNTNNTNNRRVRQRRNRRVANQMAQTILALKPKPQRVPRARVAGAPKLTPRRNNLGARNRRGNFNINAESTLHGLERITTITIPTTVTPGTLLFMLENNPNSAPRARAVASQFDTWHGPTGIEVETTGNAFAKNFIVIRHVPNGDPSRLPSDPESLLNFAEAYSRRSESYKLQLDSNAKGNVRAPWLPTTYNPHKPINDQDPSERNNGLFLIVANGSPGAEPVDITIRYRYSFRFFGPIFKALLPNLSGFLVNGATPSPTTPFGTNPVRDGPAIVANTNNTVTLTPGTYLAYLRVTGTAITAAPTMSSPGVTLTNLGVVVSTTASSTLYSFTLINNAIFTIASVAATTIDGATLRTSAFDLTIN